MNLKLSNAQNNKDETSALLKDLAKKAYFVIKYLPPLKNAQNKNNLSSLAPFENNGTVIKVGDIIKFGRVPFRVRESSVQKKSNALNTS